MTILGTIRRASGHPWQALAREDPVAAIVLARRPVTIPPQVRTGIQRRDPRSRDGTSNIGFAGSTGGVLSARQDLFVAEMPAALLEWQLNAAEEQWAQLALVVADRSPWRCRNRHRL